MDTPQQVLENWLLETTQRSLYEGHDVAQRLRRLQEQVGEGERPDQDFLLTWILWIDEKETYRSREVQDGLLDLWALHNQAMTAVG